MAIEIYEDQLELSIGLVEATMPSGELSPRERASYPYPLLTPTDRREVRQFRTVVLESAYLKVTVIPELGGRLLSLVDKRTNTEVLLRRRILQPGAKGRRGVHLQDGIQIVLQAEPRLNALGFTDYHIEVPEDDLAPGVLWVADALGGCGLSFHARWVLPPDRAELLLEVRVHNRTTEAIEYNSGLDLDLGAGAAYGTSDGAWFYSSSPKAGLAITHGDQPLTESFDSGLMKVRRFAGNKWISGHQVDSWSVSLTPISGLETVSSAGREAALGVLDDSLVLQVTEQREKGKLLMLSRDEQTLEALFDFAPEQITKIPLSGVTADPTAVTVRDAAKNTLVHWDRRVAPIAVSGPSSATSEIPPTTIDWTGLSDGELRQLTFDMSVRHLAFWEIAVRQIAAGEHASATSALESVLMYNADDPLAWWAKALVARLTTGAEEDRPDWLNAHFLAPLEPMLRAESFLSTNDEDVIGPHPLLSSLKENPETFVEVGCLLLEVGAKQDAARWLAEAVKHCDLPMLRYLLAYHFLVNSRMAVEAAEQVSVASRLPVAPPFPWRRVEKEALRTLAERFPADERLTFYHSLAKMW